MKFIRWDCISTFAFQILSHYKTVDSVAPVSELQISDGGRFQEWQLLYNQMQKSWSTKVIENLNICETKHIWRQLPLNLEAGHPKRSSKMSL